MGTYTTSEFMDAFGGLPEPGEAIPDDPDALRDQAEERERDTGQQILDAMTDHRFGGLSVREIAAAANLSASTVRTWLPKLQQQRLVRDVGVHGWWTTTGQQQGE